MHGAVVFPVLVVMKFAIPTSIPTTGASGEVEMAISLSYVIVNYQSRFRLSRDTLLFSFFSLSASLRESVASQGSSSGVPSQALQRSTRVKTAVL